MENTKLICRWAPDTQARLVMEFIKEHQLFPELNAFLRKRIR